MANRKDLLKNSVQDLDLDSIKNVEDLVRQLGRLGGFMAPRVYEAVKILDKMVRNGDCKIFLSFTANLVATGLRSVFADMIKRGFVDAVVTTGGSIDHDIARSFGGEYYSGFFDFNDEYLREQGIHRLGNIFIPFESYGEIIEREVHRILEELVKEKSLWSPSELLKEFGKYLKDENSILKAAYEAQVPIFSPGLVDSAFGTALYTFNQIQRLKPRGVKVELDTLKDMEKISNIVYESKKMGALIVGGGISKHHVIWWAQFKGGLDYAIYITTAVEWDGSLSGAKLKEAISWGKVKPSAKKVTIYGDATIILPLIYIPVRSLKGG